MQQHPTRSGVFKLTALIVVERQGVSQERERCALWSAAIAPLKHADSLRAHPGAFSEGRLGESDGESVAPKQRPEV